MSVNITIAGRALIPMLEGCAQIRAGAGAICASGFA